MTVPEGSTLQAKLGSWGIAGVPQKWPYFCEKNGGFRKIGDPQSHVIQY
jgi:hypothetical protein